MNEAYWKALCKLWHTFKSSCCCWKSFILRHIVACKQPSLGAADEPAGMISGHTGSSPRRFIERSRGHAWTYWRKLKRKWKDAWFSLVNRNSWHWKVWGISNECDFYNSVVCFIRTPDRMLAMQLMMCQFMENWKIGKWRVTVWVELAASTVSEKSVVLVENQWGGNPMCLAVPSSL